MSENQIEELLQRAHDVVEEAGFASLQDPLRTVYIIVVASSLATNGGLWAIMDTDLDLVDVVHAYELIGNMEAASALSAVCRDAFGDLSLGSEQRPFAFDEFEAQYPTLVESHQRRFWDADEATVNLLTAWLSEREEAE